MAAAPGLLAGLERKKPIRIVGSSHYTIGFAKKPVIVK